MVCCVLIKEELIVHDKNTYVWLKRKSWTENLEKLAFLFEHADKSFSEISRPVPWNCYKPPWIKENVWSIGSQGFDRMAHDKTDGSSLWISNPL